MDTSISRVSFLATCVAAALSLSACGGGGGHGGDSTNISANISANGSATQLLGAMRVELRISYTATVAPVFTTVSNRPPGAAVHLVEATAAGYTIKSIATVDITTASHDHRQHRPGSLS